MNARIGILLLIGVALLAIGGLYWVDQYMRYREAEAKRFSARDTAAIVRIDLVEKHADTVYAQLYLVRREGRWWVNDTLEAFADPLRRLMKVLAGQTPRAPVAPTALQNILRFIKDHRIEVTVHYADGKREEFYVGGPTPDQRASYMLKVGADQPYEVFLPGLEGYLTPYYRPDLSTWQENLVFQAVSADLQRISLTYFDDPAKTWTLQRPQPEAPWQLLPEGIPDSLRIAEYLLHYTGKFSADELAPPDSLSGLLPLYELSLQTFSQQRFQVTIYPHRSSPLHYYLRIHHRPYFTYTISRSRMDTYVVPRSYFLRSPA